MTTIGDLLARATELAPVSSSPRLDVEVLLCHCLGCDRSRLFARPEQAVDADALRSFETLLARRRHGEPIAHLTGEREFWSLALKVTPDTLIPRPDTELLVETALARWPADRARVLDLGTGTGAIALALATERPGWTLVAVDSSPAAVALARENAARHGLDRVRIMASDWFEAVQGPFDLIVANPPYIAAHDHHLGEGDVRFEPASALVAGNGGLDDLTRIIGAAVNHLTPAGLLMVEHGADQGQAVRRLFAGAGYQRVETLRDLSGLERVTLGVY